jgi:hypothetical protein
MEEQPSILSTWQVISWWEWRRLAFNGLLLLIGIAALIGFEILMEKAIAPGEDAEEPFGLFLSFVAYGVMANVCYTPGWLVELIQREKDPVLARERGKRNFRRGMWFSCILTTAPFWFALLFYVLSSTHSR